MDTSESQEQVLLEEQGMEEVPEKTNSSVYYFGCRCWHPKWIQILASTKFYTLCLCFAAIVEGAIVSGFTSIVISTIERRYQFTSTSVGFLVVSFDLSVLICVIFISYFGDKNHKPHIVGYGIVIQGIGALIFASPQFFFGSYSTGLTSNLTLEACDMSSEESSNCGSSNSIAYCIILLGNILIGIGASPLFTIAVSYIDDVSMPKYVPIHSGIFYACATIGPALGYALGGAFLSIYVDPWISTQLEETDPGWVGAWWICFVVSGILSFIVAIPFFLFPRFLSNHQDILEARQKLHVKQYTSRYGDEKTLKNQIKAFPKHLLDLGKSHSFIFVTSGISFLFLTLNGLVSFGPKFIESVFSIPSSTSSLIAGAVAIPAGGLGTLTGAIISYLLKSDTKKISILSWVATLLAVPALFGFFLTCPSLQIAGISTPYVNTSYTPSKDVTISSCNYDCLCTSSIYEPVCGADDLTYFSPCRAGCMKRHDEEDLDVPIFENCSCISDNLMNNNATFYSNSASNSNATNGKCPQTCNNLGLWLFLIGLVVFLIFVLQVPVILITIRSVAEEQRTLALGVQSFCFRAVGAIPGPILYGVIFDSSCVYWQEVCGRRGNCWVYDNDLISIRSFILSFIGVVTCVILLILCWIYFPPVSFAICRARSSEQHEAVVYPNKTDKIVENPVFVEARDLPNETELSFEPAQSY